MDTVKQISPRAEQLMSEYQLGNVKAEYKENMLKTGLVLVALSPVSLLVLVPVIATLHPSSFAPNGDWLHAPEQLGNLLAALMWGGCFLLIGVKGIVLFVVTLWKGEKRVYIGSRRARSSR